jgi:membrane protease YdiL (CAAX protease family)
MLHIIQRRPLLCFYLLAFAITWGVWLPAAAATAGWLPFMIPRALDGAAYFCGPSLAAIIVVAATDGRTGVHALLGRLLAWRVGAGWYVFALLWRPALFVVTLALLAARGIALAPLDPWDRLVSRFLLFTLLGLVAYVGEEIGWRGYALRQLQGRMGPIAASFVVGSVAGLWHLPAFFIAGHPQYGTPIVPFMVWMIALALIFTWLFNRTNGSLLPVALLHAAINGTGAAFPPLPLVLDLAATLVVALVVALLGRAAPQVTARPYQR